MAAIVPPISFRVNVKPFSPFSPGSPPPGQLVMCAVAKGQVFTPERLRINAEDLIIPQDALTAAFGKARRELDYIPGVAEIRRLALADDATVVDAEMRRAWEAVVKFADKWRRWNDDRDRAYVESDAPALPQRIVDTVRRTGRMVDLSRAHRERVSVSADAFFGRLGFLTTGFNV